MTKKFLCLLLLALFLGPARATSISTTTGTQTIAGRLVPVVMAPPSTTAYYRLAYMTVVRGGVNVNVFKALVYAKGKGIDMDNLDCFTTYAEVQADFTAKSIQGTLPPKPAGAP